MNLRYHKPARIWTEALPVGNGRLGGMVFGGNDLERIALNEDTLWSGFPRDWNNPQALEVLPQVREHIAAGEYEAAEALSKQAMMGPYTQSYMPLGDLHIRFYHGHFTKQYCRTLNLDNATATVSYSIGDVEYKRELIASAPDQALIYRLTSSKPGGLNIRMWLDSPLRSTSSWGDDYYRVQGYCPEEVMPNYYNTAHPIRYGDEATTNAMRFESRLEWRTDELAKVTVSNNGVHIDNAQEIIIIVDAETGFAGFDQLPNTPATVISKQLTDRMNLVATKTYDQLYQRHVGDYQALYKRVSFDIATNDMPQIEETLSTDKRLTEWGIRDSSLIPLLFQYGRYLLISSSRPGTQPANLQGIWNSDARPIWSCNYTLNINAEMNYWLAETANLAECHEPLLAFITELAQTGSETAAINYGSRGWTAHHNTDIWRQTAPPGDYGHGNPLWANWPMGGVWLCAHLWEHYRFNQNTEYLRDTAYPVMLAAAQFCLDYMYEAEDGAYVTSPSTSPEHRFKLADGREPALSIATTMDMSVIRELFSHCLQAAEILQLEENEQLAQIKHVLPKLPLPKIGTRGNIQEWLEDYGDEDEHHRHVSHLYDIYPGYAWGEETAPELYEAARTTLNIRGDGGTGWSLAWKVALWARLKDGDRATQLLRNLLVLTEDDGEMDFLRGGLYTNFLVAHPPFQIDGNFGVVAGIIELLLQSHQPFIELLPALPSNWCNGRVTGLRARGGYTCDVAWQAGKLLEATITPDQAGVISVKYQHPVQIVDASGKQVAYTTTQADPVTGQHMVSFEGNSSTTYMITLQQDENE
ncbi:glycoside hydrolase N-terminal domain-containing protein [Paenibacillus yanchengensis]|uniref:Glycoside hydrolase N-terminal domain-containing protein n=1 Tax=Paenibacillus yanchengensis TaxID=2035833 RepID=A0ABW4YPI9_9BACL